MDCDKCDGTGQVVDPAALQARIDAARCPKCGQQVVLHSMFTDARGTPENPAVFCNHCGAWYGVLSDCKQETVESEDLQARIKAARCPKCGMAVIQSSRQDFNDAFCATSENPVMYCSCKSYYFRLSDCNQQPPQPKGVPEGCVLWELEIKKGEILLADGRCFGNRWPVLEFAPRDPRFVGCGYAGPDDTVDIFADMRAARHKTSGQILPLGFMALDAYEPILPRWVVMRETPCEF